MDALLRDGAVLRFPASGGGAEEAASSRLSQEHCLQKLENLVLAQKRQQLRMRELLTASENRNAQVITDGRVQVRRRVLIQHC